MVFRKHPSTFVLILLAVATVFPGMSFAQKWNQLKIPNQPAARMGAAMAYDPVSGKTVMFGGVATLYPQGTVFYNDTWVFDGRTWTQLQPPISPPGRTSGAMGYDAHSKKLVMFGGFNDFAGAYLQDTWVWDGAKSTWTEVTMAAPPPAATGAVVFTDPANGRAVMFGGFNANQRVAADGVTWRWTGKSWRQLHPPTNAIPRGWGFAANDPVHKNVVLGGGEGDTISTNDTWTWDGHTWTQQFPATQVDALLGAGAVYDADLQTVIVFGGFDLPLGQEMNQTWSWDGSNWVQLSPSNPPRPRDTMAMAYDPINHAIVMFGGALKNGTVLRETWTFTNN